MTKLLAGVIVFFLLIGVPIFAAMSAFAILGETAMHPEMSVSHAFSVGIAKVIETLTGPAAATLATLPLFVFTGYIMAEAKTADRLVKAANAWLGWFPGGLAIVTVVTCAFFTTVTGASGVTIVAIGGLMMPALLKQGYKERFSLGLVTGTGSIGLLFPPALPLIVYGIVYGIAAQSMADEGGATEGAMKLASFDVSAFVASGLLPGLLLVVCVAVYAVLIAIRDRVPRLPFTGEKLWEVTIKAVPELLLPVILFVPIITGVFLIPEAAAVGALYILVLEVGFFRDIKVGALWKITREAMTLVGAIFIIIVAATTLTQFFVDADVPDKLYKWMGQYIDNKWTFLLALNFLLLIVGCLMDIFSAIVVVVPLIAPAAKQYGIDPYHLGVIFLLNLEIGYLTPPVGLNLFITSFRFRKPMVNVYRAALPFMGVMLVALILVTYLPLVFPSLTKLLRLAEKQTTEQTEPPPKPEGPVVDAGLANVKIDWLDGAVWTPARCEQPEIKENELDYADCIAMFKLYPKCDTLPEELQRMECKDLVKEGKDPFTPDAGSAEPEPAPAAVDGGK